MKFAEFRASLLAVSITMLLISCGGADDDCTSQSDCLETLEPDQKAQARPEPPAAAEPDDPDPTTDIDDEQNTGTRPPVQSAPRPPLGDQAGKEEVIEALLDPDACSAAQLSALDTFNDQDSGDLSPRMVRGQVTYERPAMLDNGRLDYTNILSVPLYGASINSIACDGSLVSVDPISADGGYSILVPSNLDVSFQIVASEERIGNSNSTWKITVVDNNNDGDTYVEQVNPYLPSNDLLTKFRIEQPAEGSIFRTERFILIANSEDENDVNFHLPLGWDNQTEQYLADERGHLRTSAAFAAGDTVFRALDLLIAPNNSTKGFGMRASKLEMGNITIAWSDKNVQQDNVADTTYLPKSYYDAENKTIYLLGQEGFNTDEFDIDVIHDLVLEAVLVESGIRFDGFLNPRDVDLDGVYDARIAFEKGFYYGYTAAMNDLGLYRDSRGSQSTTPDSIAYNIESTVLTNPGWFNPFSVAQIVHDLIDLQDVDNDGGQDVVEILSYELIEGLLEANRSGSFLTLFSFINAMKRTHFEDLDGRNDDPNFDFFTLLQGASLGGLDLESNYVLPSANSQLAGIDTLLSDQQIAFINAFDDNYNASLLSESFFFKKIFGDRQDTNLWTWGGQAGLFDLYSDTQSDAYGMQINNLAGLSRDEFTLPYMSQAGNYGGEFCAGIGSERIAIVEKVLDQYIADNSNAVTTFIEMTPADFYNVANLAFNAFNETGAVTDNVKWTFNGGSQLNAYNPSLNLDGVDSNGVGSYTAPSCTCNTSGTTIVLTGNQLRPRLVSEIANTLPNYNYKTFSDEVCVTNELGLTNKPGNYRHVAFTVYDKNELECSSEWIDNKPDIRISMAITTSDIPADQVKTSYRLLRVTPTAIEPVTFADGVFNPNIDSYVSLEPGAYILEISTPGNIGIENEPAGEVCYQVSVDDSSWSTLN